MNKTLTFIILLAVVFAPVYAVASEINLDLQPNEALPGIEYAPSTVYIPVDSGYTVESPSLLTNVIAGLYKRPCGLEDYEVSDNEPGIILSPNYDTEESTEEAGSSTTTWIVIGVLAAVATLVVLGILLSSEGGCGG